MVKYDLEGGERLRHRKYLRQLRYTLKPGRVIENCGCDVARILSVDWKYDNIWMESLTEGGQGSCSIYNCGPVVLKPEQIKKRLEIFKRAGKEGLVEYWSSGYRNESL